MKTSKLAVFCDFDGTILLQDSGTVLIDSSLGRQNRLDLDKKVLNGEISFREAVEIMWKSYKSPLETGLELLKDCEFDPFFWEFYRFTAKASIPLSIVSAGLVPLLNHFLDLSNHPAHPHLNIFANSVKIDTSTGWEIIYRDDTRFGHDKGHHLRLAKETDPNSTIIFVGDGISDLSAAKEAHLVFAREGKDLQKWCKSENIPCTPFTDFSIIIETIKTLIN
jgi:2,3-diketo-5-methylthio-1-phosphopentane phosphatase